MGRSVRMVPADWKHPKYADDYYESHRRGKYIPLLDGDYNKSAAKWDENFRQRQLGLRESYADGDKWVPVEPEYAGMRYTDYAGSRPSPDDYMPTFSPGTATYLMMYEDTSEGTPISPAFATPEELAHWLADNGASSFGKDTATYNQWLPICKGGWAPSMVMSGGKLMSGIEFMAQDKSS